MDSPRIVLFTEDFLRADAYRLHVDVVATGDPRGVAGFLLSRSRAGAIVELSSARSLDALRMILGDSELAACPVLGIAVDPSIAASARAVGLQEIAPEGAWQTVKDFERRVASQTEAEA